MDRALVCVALAVLASGCDNYELLSGGGTLVDGGEGPDSAPRVAPFAFRKVGTIPTGNCQPTSAVIADMNRDQRADVLFTNGNWSQVGMALGGGDGSFTEVQPAAAQGTLNPRAIAVADIDRDGFVDLLVAAGDGLDEYKGSGQSIFSPFNGFNDSYLDNSSSLAIGDFDGDGKLDVAVADAVNVRVCYQGATFPWFHFPRTLSVGASATALVAGDFNGDAALDLAVILAPSVSVSLGKGDGTFGDPVTYGAHTLPRALFAADFDGDGKTDLAVANFDSADVSILLAAASGFRPPIHYPLGARPDNLVAGDFDGNGKLDLAVSSRDNHAAVILLGNGDGSFAGGYTFSLASDGPDAIAAGDLDGNGRSDLVAIYTLAKRIDVLLDVPR